MKKKSIKYLERSGCLVNICVIRDFPMLRTKLFQFCNRQMGATAKRRAILLEGARTGLERTACRRIMRVPMTLFNGRASWLSNTAVSQDIRAKLETFAALNSPNAFCVFS